MDGSLASAKHREVVMVEEEEHLFHVSEAELEKIKKVMDPI